MSYKQANRRFTSTIAVSMAVFLGACLALTWANKFTDTPKPLLWFACILPVVALLTPVWAQWRFINEIDEYLRSIQLKAIFLGLAALLLLASAWGFVEMYVGAPPVSMFWLNPVYWVAYSIGATYLMWREGSPT
jgi:hypothetical protein